MNEYDLTALPSGHEQVWRQAAPDVVWVLRELRQLGVEARSILVVVAAGDTLPGELLEEALTGWLVAGPCGASPTTPVAAVLVGDAARDFVGDHKGASDYMARLPGGCCGLLVLTDDGPVISACTMPTMAGPASEDTRPPPRHRRQNRRIIRLDVSRDR
ncbi:MAG: hypothetical protein V2A79_02600 [Planctomycetota bacterium]